MKYFLGVISVLTITVLISIAWINHTNLIELDLPLTNLTLVTNKFTYLALLVIGGAISGFIAGLAIMIHQKDKLAPYKRQLEKISVMNDSSQSKVEVLEAKIKTLETALKQALESK